MVKRDLMPAQTFNFQAHVLFSGRHVKSLDGVGQVLVAIVAGLPPLLSLIVSLLCWDRK
jgi:hypothetical protein